MKMMHRVIVLLFFVFMCLPIAVTLIYSFSTEWGKSLLPGGLTLKWYIQLYSDPQFIVAVVRSFVLTVITLAAVLIILVPSFVLISLYLPVFDRVLRPVVLLPYAIPGVVLATALMGTYSAGFVPLLVILSGGLFLYALPFMYQSIQNSLSEVDGHAMMEAAELLGASKPRAFVRIILPNIRIGVMVGSLLTFSAFFGEFQLTNMILGGDFETIRIYMLRVMQINGHLSSAVVMTYLALLILISACMVRLTHVKKRQPASVGSAAAATLMKEGAPANELLNR